MTDFLGTQGNDTLIGFGFADDDRIFGFGGNDFLDGGDGNDLLLGDAGNDTLEGGSGDDFLEGGSGNDRFSGELGNDTYIVDSVNDIITEVANSGFDNVRSFVSFTLPSNVENLTLITGALNGTGNDLGNDILGNTQQHPQGGNGDDFLGGFDGNDSLNGGVGDDFLRGDAGNDSLNGSDGNDSLNGEAGNDFLNGGDGDDLLAGGFEGNDTLTGGMGNDRIFGDTGADRFRFNAATEATEGVDTIVDFVAVDDAIQVRASGFGGGLTAGSTISAVQFRIGFGALDATDRFIYNNFTGSLSFDADGVGGEFQEQIATLTGIPTLSAADIVVI